MTKQIVIILFFLTGLVLSSEAINDSRLMRYPDINGDLITFVYAGDIWTVNSSGGDARRLTSHEGMELFPKISPDRKWIAFSGEYSGSRQIFIIPSEGGIPKQLTWYNSVGVMPPRGGYDNIVLDWTPDSKNILFRSNRTEFGERNGKYYTVNINGGLETPLPIANGGIATFSPNAKKLCFTPVDREFRSWKRYKGGRATDLWIYDINKNKSEQITQFKGSDQWPVWNEDKIFFASDRDLKLNIYSYDIKSKATKQITHFKKMDVLWPSGQNGQMVFENDGYLYKLNMNTGNTEKIVVNIHFDNPNLIPYFKNVKDNIHSFAISSTGKRALFDARGDIFSVPAENGTTENLTHTQGIREIYPSWSPDGKYISWYSDATGEYELYLQENEKGVAPIQLTNGSSAWKYENKWSPNSKYLIYSDRSLQLKLVDIETKKEIIIDKATNSEIRDYTFSPDSKWITYSKESTNGQSSIWVFNIDKKKNYQVTDSVFNDINPVFSKDGNYLFFCSTRDFNLTFSSFEFDYLYNNAMRIYALILKKDGPKIFKDKNDIEPIKEEKKDNEKKETDNDKKKVDVKIDFDGINGRIVVLPPVAGYYRNLIPVEGGLLYINGGKLEMYNIAEEKSKEIMNKVTQVTVSADSKTLLYRFNGDYGITALNSGVETGEGKLNLSDLTMKIDPKKEWKQIFDDAHRIFRDYFYVNNLHGVNWKSIKSNYGKWLPSVSHRADLDHILNEMVAESNTGHSYVNWGDFKKVKRIDGGLLGATLLADTKAKKYKITKIYDGENWNNSRISPLTLTGVDVNEGDYLISINGEKITTDKNPYIYLENLAGKRTEITVSAKGDGSNPRTSVIEPIKSELEIKYLTWVNQRRELVDKLSNGRIGYIHVPNTSFEGNRELFKGMYAYHDKEALIIDDRYNGGGFIPEVMAGLLSRKPLSYWQSNGLTPMQTPSIAHNGPKAMLINGYSSSGGDAFPYYFKKNKLGTLIGTRTWGGLVGISGNAVFVDGGSLNVPRFGVFNENGEWIIEGVGIYPDIEVIDRPEQLAKGQDPCIERAIEVLLKQLKENPIKKINAPQPPNRAGWIEKDIE